MILLNSVFEVAILPKHSSLDQFPKSQSSVLFCSALLLQLRENRGRENVVQVVRSDESVVVSAETPLAESMVVSVVEILYHHGGSPSHHGPQAQSRHSPRSLGTAFTTTERDRLDLRGLLPPNVMSTEQQVERFMADLKRLEVQARDGPSDPYALAKWRILNRLHDRNETMYYNVSLKSSLLLFRMISSPPPLGSYYYSHCTFNLVPLTRRSLLRFSLLHLVRASPNNCFESGHFSLAAKFGLFRRPRGMYFSAEDSGEMMSMVYNWPADQVDMIVVTDGSRILGLGDLGVQGIGIAIGKLDLYVAAAGINPQRVLPVMIDVGTNNEKLLKDKTRCRHRLDGDEYIAVVDEFMEAVFTRWPHVIVQSEDFQSKWAFKLLQRYRTTYRMFNDDVQGTAGVAIAGLLGAVRAQGRPMIDFPKQKIVVAGAGSAGIGVLNAARKTMARMLGNNESAFESALRQFWVVDANMSLTSNSLELYYIVFF
ncbi:Malic oxidoreductase [Trema orientale]|uniref:Malic enzyme n=1 Tax=Trema orientale TaxID=63057 RepID=A0A2P5FC62_TREOI|nr:Malic oxidoreductase [Trema orientale]